jgi:glycosyltransferase involved in cell wall biosynthesis
MPILEVLKPVFEQSQFVPAIVKNIEDYSSDQIVTWIQDDCSSDGTFEAYCYRSPRHTRLSRTATRMGARANVSSMLSSSTGDYISFSAGDDFLVPRVVHRFPTLMRENPADIYIYRCLRLPSRLTQKLVFSKDPFDFGIVNFGKSLKNVEATATGCGRPRELFEIAAKNPGFMWNQGLIVRGDLARAVGYLPAGGLDDWGFQHGLFKAFRKTDYKCVCLTEVIAVISDSAGSLGSDACKQLQRQVDGVHRFWDSELRKDAFLNVVSKKISQFQDSKYSYSEIYNAFASCFLEKLGGGPFGVDAVDE